MAQKGLIITFGELGHKKFKRIDYVQKTYNIQSLEQFTLENINKHVIKYATQFQKKLTPAYIRDYNYIGRIYYTVTPQNKEEEI